MSKRWELRKGPRAKAVANVDNFYHFFFTRWVWCEAKFPDEKQRLYMSLAMLMASIFGCRPVSLFDTRVKTATNKARGDDNSDAEPDVNMLTYSDSRLIDRGDLWDDGDLDGGVVNEADSATFHDLDKSSEEDTDMADDTDPDIFSNTEGDMDRDSVTDPDVFSDIEGDTDIDSDTGPDIISHTERDADSDFNCQVDDSSITDDEYDAGREEIRTILWRHIASHIIRSPIQGRPNILLAKVTLLHTKGEDRKPRM